MNFYNNQKQLSNNIQYTITYTSNLILHSNLQNL